MKDSISTAFYHFLKLWQIPIKNNLSYETELMSVMFLYENSKTIAIKACWRARIRFGLDLLIPSLMKVKIGFETSGTQLNYASHLKSFVTP